MSHTYLLLPLVFFFSTIAWANPGGEIDFTKNEFKSETRIGTLFSKGIYLAEQGFAGMTHFFFK